MPKPIPAPERRRYHRMRSCSGKRRYETYAEALVRGAQVYACDYCGGFHRTSKAPDAEQQRKLIERIYGYPVTPEKVTRFQEANRRFYGPGALQ